MRVLVDQCLSPDFAAALAAAGHDVLHVRDLGMARAPDADVLELAQTQGRTLLSADTDFGTIFGAEFSQPTVRRHLPPHDP